MFAMPNGAHPAVPFGTGSGGWGSVNCATSLKLLSNTKTFPARKFVAKRAGPELRFPTANTLNTLVVIGSGDEGLTINVAFSRLTWGFQPQIPPSSPSKINMAGFLVFGIKNAFGDELKTMPVGAAVCGLPVSTAVGGSITKFCPGEGPKSTGVPSGPKSVETPAPLSFTQKTFAVGLITNPQAFTTFGSVRSATPATSLCRFSQSKNFALA